MKEKSYKNFFNDITIENTAVAVSSVATKQSAKRESYTRFTRGILSTSFQRFHGNRYTASLLEMHECKLGIVRCWPCSNTACF